MKPKPATLTSGRSVFHLHLDGEYRKEVPAPYKIADTFADGSPTMEHELKPRMNGTERQFHEMLLTRGYAKVEFEAITLTLARGARYTPDFYCTLEFGKFEITFYECKNNFIREASLVRLKVAARLYPEFRFILAQKKNGIWSEAIVRGSAQS